LGEKQKYVDDFEKKVKMPLYETNVPEKIKKENSEKINNSIAEITKIKDSIALLQNVNK